MKNIDKYNTLNFIYCKSNLKSENYDNWWLVKGITADKISDKYKNKVSELSDEYIKYTNHRNNWMWHYLSVKWMNYVESNKWFFWIIELFISDYPNILKFLSWGIMGSLITLLLKLN